MRILPIKAPPLPLLLYLLLLSHAHLSAQIRLIMKSNFVRKGLVPTPVWDSLQSVFFDENKKCGNQLDEAIPTRRKSNQALLPTSSTRSKRGNQNKAKTGQAHRLGQMSDGLGTSRTRSGPRKPKPAPPSSVLMTLTENENELIPAPQSRALSSKIHQKDTTEPLKDAASCGQRLFDDLEHDGGLVKIAPPARLARNRSNGRRQISKIKERGIHYDPISASVLTDASCGADQKRPVPAEACAADASIRGGGCLMALFSQDIPSIPCQRDSGQRSIEMSTDVPEQAPLTRRQVKPKSHRTKNSKNIGTVDESLTTLHHSPRLLASGDAVDPVAVACSNVLDATADDAKMSSPNVQTSQKRRQVPPFSSPGAKAVQVKRTDTRLTPVRLMEQSSALATNSSGELECEGAKDREVPAIECAEPGHFHGKVGIQQCSGETLHSHQSKVDVTSDHAAEVACDPISCRADLVQPIAGASGLPADLQEANHPTESPNDEEQQNGAKEISVTTRRDGKHCPANMDSTLQDCVTHPEPTNVEQDPREVEFPEDLQRPVGNARVKDVAKSNDSECGPCESGPLQETAYLVNTKTDNCVDSGSNERNRNLAVSQNNGDCDQGSRQGQPMPAAEAWEPSLPAETSSLIDDAISDVTMSVVTDGQMGCENDLEIPCIVSFPLQRAAFRPPLIENNVQQGRDRHALSDEYIVEPEIECKRSRSPLLARVKESNCFVTEGETQLERPVGKCGIRLREASVSDDQQVGKNLESSSNSPNENRAVNASKPGKRRSKKHTEVKKPAKRIPVKKSQMSKSDAISARRSTRQRAVPARLGAAVGCESIKNRDCGSRWADHRPPGTTDEIVGRESPRTKRKEQTKTNKKQMGGQDISKADEVHNACVEPTLASAVVSGRPQRLRHQPERFGNFVDISDQEDKYGDSVHSDTCHPSLPTDSSSMTVQKALNPVAHKVDVLLSHTRPEPKLQQDVGQVDANDLAPAKDAAVEWSTQQLKLLREGYDRADPTSSSFWMDVSFLANIGKSSFECRDKWFSLVKTPQPPRGNVLRTNALKGLRADEDDVFNSTPMRTEESIAVKLLSTMKIAIQKEAGEDEEDESNVNDDVSIHRGAKPGLKTYIQAMRRDMLRSKKERRKKKVGQPAFKTKGTIVESRHNGDVDMDIRLTPGGTLRVNNLDNEEDDFWDELYEGEDED